MSRPYRAGAVALTTSQGFSLGWYVRPFQGRRPEEGGAGGLPSAVRGPHQVLPDQSAAAAPNSIETEPSSWDLCSGWYNPGLALRSGAKREASA